MANHRKLKCTSMERTIFGEGDGSGMQVVDTPMGRLGSLICWEHVQPLFKYCMYAQHEQIHVASWPSFSLYKGSAYAFGSEANASVAQVYAMEGCSYVVHASNVVDETLLETLKNGNVVGPLGSTPEQVGMMLATGGGSSRVYGPDGAPCHFHFAGAQQVKGGLQEDVEGIVYGEVDLAAITAAKLMTDCVGHNARPDVARAILDISSRAPASFE